MIQSRIPDFPGVGQKWSYEFIKKNGDQVSMKWGCLLQTICACSLTPQTVEGWFKLISPILKDVPPENIYNMDESGFNLGLSAKKRVIVPVGTKTAHITCGAEQENITVMATICADGTALTPTVIFPGKYMKQRWGENNPLSAQ